MKAKDEMKTLERMLDAADETISGNVPQPGALPELHSEPGFDIDYDKLQRKCNNQAKKMLKNATGLMIGDEHVKNNPYIQDKLKTDIISLGGMLYQVELMITMQRALSEEIRHGATSARMFEVFGTLGKTISENNKQLLQTVEAIKLTYQDLSDNVLNITDEGPKQIGDGGLTRNDNGIISMGTKDLIQQAQELKRKKRLQDAEDAKVEE